MFPYFLKPRDPSKQPESTAVCGFFGFSEAQEHTQPFPVSLVSLKPKSIVFSSLFGFSEAQEHSLFEFLLFFCCQVAQVQQIAVFAEPQVAPVREIAVFVLLVWSVFSEAKAPRQATQEHCGFDKHF